MPELPEVEAVRQLLLPVMRARRIDRVTLHRDGLRRRFDPAFIDLVEGQRVDDIVRRGKHLLVQLGSGDVVALHLGMSGDFRIEPRGPLSDERRLKHDHVVIELATGTVVFSDPRRFGAMDLLRAGAVPGAIAAMGPEPLSPDFTPEALARALAGRRTAIKVALLDQRVVAGIGNIYASEALHHGGLSPRRQAAALVTPGGRPRPAAVRLVTGIRTVLAQAIARQETAYRAGRFRVYEREDRPCRRRGCGGVIARIVQAGRSTYYCPRCQR
jgi:formamidopyrimidine-DNA glycosylase